MLHVAPPAKRISHAFRAPLREGGGSGAVKRICVPRVLVAFIGQTTFRAFNEKHGSEIALPTMQRYASVRPDAMEFVQHFPLAVRATLMERACTT